MSEVLIPMQGYNLSRATPAGDEHLDRYTKCHTHSMLDELMDALAAKRPAWTYVAYGYGTQVYGGCYRVDHIRICENGQTLGTVSREWFNRGDSYAIDNHRMRGKRERGRATHTKDLKKAVKHILDNFYSLTPAELVSAARSTAASKLSDIVGRADRKYADHAVKLREDMVAFAFEHWDEFCKQRIEMSKVPYRDGLPEAKQKRDEAMAFHNSWQNGTGIMVVTTDRTYYLTSPRLEERQDLAPDEVPAYVRSAIGMLKLIEVGQYIPDIGIRAADNTFFISAQP